MITFEMKDYLRSKYNGIYNGKSVDEMSDKQVFAIYNSLINREKKTVSVDKVDDVSNQQHDTIIFSDDKSSVINTETDEYFTKEEWEKMNE